MYPTDLSETLQFTSGVLFLSDFIYFNNAGSEEFGIDPAFLCECALNTSEPSVSEQKLNSSEGKFL